MAGVPKARRLKPRIQRAVLRGFERWYGIDTSGRETLEELGLEDDELVSYVGGQWLPLRRALRALRPGPDDVFADLGAGKGRALVAAGRFPFKRVIGVEIADELAQAARRNLDRAGPRLRADSFEVITADARHWAVHDDVSVVFLYCPFLGEAFSQALARIFASYDRNPRELHLLYAYPWEHNRLVATGRVEVVDVHPGLWPTRRGWPSSQWVMPVYRVIAAGTTPRPAAAARRRRGRRQALEIWSGANDVQFGRPTRAGRHQETNERGFGP